MKQLLIRADDIGYSYAVNLGLARSVNEGLVRSAGLMPNMPEAERGYSWIADADIAIGQHTNFCLGTPCADPAQIPSLVDEHGQLKSSKEFRAAYAAGKDFVVVEQAIIEAEAQLERFRQIVGRDPDYFEAHAVASKNLYIAIAEVAERNGIKEQKIVLETPTLCGSTMVKFLLEDGLPPEQYDPAGFIKRTVEGMDDGETCICVFHPGYLDTYLLENSSLTINRAKEVDALIDPELRGWLEAQDGLRLVDYRDL